ncbi:MAG: hypothetical protein PHE70_03075 [Tepidanaerobacteraceae bacterium]|nr:hypothetical protein [Tepidanaerobacteraceae bacterium]
MGKKIITKQDVEKWYFEGVKEIYQDDNTILLPGAKDALMVAGIKMKVKDCQEEQIKKVINECCNDKSIDNSIRDKIVKTVIEKYMAKMGGE